MEIKNLTIDKVIPYIRNPRKNDNAVEKVASSIHEFGFRQPIVVDDENVIIAGHTRFEAAKRLGMDTVPVHVAKGLTEQQVKAYRIADNRVAQESDWDMDLLKLELQELDDPELTGFDEDELQNILLEIGEGLTDPDEIPDVPDEPFTTAGDLWEMGGHRLLCGDSTNLKDVERLMNGKTAQMVFTDPPYGVDYEGGTKKWNKLAGDGRGFENLYSAVADAKDFIDDKSSLYICFAGMKSEEVFKALREGGLNLKNMIIWSKNNAQFGMLGANYHQKHEPVLFAIKGRTYKWYGANNEVTVWDIARASKNEFHSTQKPVELVVRAIENSSLVGNTILDLFCGGGSTLMASQKTGRKCYGMELDPHYCDVIVTRWSEFTGKDDVLINGEPFKWSEREIRKVA